jgi:hypothetical protein
MQACVAETRGGVVGVGRIEVVGWRVGVVVVVEDQEALERGVEEDVPVRGVDGHEFGVREHVQRWAVVSDVTAHNDRERAGDAVGAVPVGEVVAVAEGLQLSGDGGEGRGGGAFDVD